MHVACTAGDHIAALVRESLADSIVLAVAAGDDLLALAVTRAAIGPLAIERGPNRLNAVIVHDGADPADVAATVAYLDTAPATTGQILDIQRRVRPQGPSEASTNA